MKKTVVIALLLIMITLSLIGASGAALAEEFDILSNYYISENFTQEEIEFSLYNLQDKLECEKLPRLIRVEEIFDFNEEALYGLYEFENYYMLVIRETGSILERGEGNSPYYGKNNGVKYYGGYGYTYVLMHEGYKNLLTEEFATNQEVQELESKMQTLRQLDYQDYQDANMTPILYGASNRKRIKKIGNSISDLVEYIYGDKDYLYNYFIQNINIDYLIKNSATFEENTIDQVLYTREGFKDEVYGYAGFEEFDYGYDVLYPKNIYNSCSVTAMVMVLQYYYRTQLNSDLIDADFAYRANYNFTVLDQPMDSLCERLCLDMLNRIKVLSGSGAATYVNIDAAFERYFDSYGMDGVKSTHFTSYTNMKKAIDSGHPAIMTIGAGTGYDINNNKASVSGHTLVAYGYTTNSIGVMDEFICHGGWHYIQGEDSDAECARLFVNKFNAAGNVYISY